MSLSGRHRNVTISLGSQEGTVIGTGGAEPYSHAVPACRLLVRKAGGRADGCPASPASQEIGGRGGGLLLSHPLHHQREFSGRMVRRSASAFSTPEAHCSEPRKPCWQKP